MASLTTPANESAGAAGGGAIGGGVGGAVSGGGAAERGAPGGRAAVAWLEQSRYVSISAINLYAYLRGYLVLDALDSVIDRRN